MPNKNYVSGRRFEYKVKKHLEENGYLVFRSAGSHSIADLIAISKGDTLLIQCKHYGKMPLKELANLIHYARKYDCVPMHAYMEKRKMIIAEVKEL